MIPYLHIGPLSLPTFGLMVATGLLVAAYVLQSDFRRRGIRADAFLIIGIAGLAGIVGARLYHALESPGEFFADPKSFIFTRFGFAWFGGFLGGFAALVMIGTGWLARFFDRLDLRDFAKHRWFRWLRYLNPQEFADGLRVKSSIMEFLDACSPAACVGYAIGRIGCLLSGDGDYGIPTNLPWGMSFPNGVVPTTERVHPTPLYEFFVWMLIAYMLWRMGARFLRESKPNGWIFCAYLILTGMARFLVEIIRLNPRSFFGMSNAQTASVASVALGITLLLVLSRAPVFVRRAE